MRAITERGEKSLEVLTRVEREVVALTDGAQYAEEPVEVARLLGDDARALRFVDVLPRLLPHRAEEVFWLAREIDQERASRLDEHWRGTHATPRELGAHVFVGRDLRIAQ